MVIRATWFASLIGAAMLAAGCGGSDESATTKWFDNVCSAVTTWQDSISQAGQSLKNNPSKEGLESAFTDAKDATSTLSDELKSAGKPDTESGEQAKQKLNALSTQLDDGVAKMQDSVDGVSTVNQALTAVSTVSGTLATMGTQINSTVDDLRTLDPKGELQTAFDEADSCAPLKS